MNKRDLHNAITILREKADLNKLVIFVGAGVSQNTPGMPSWRDLVNEMAKAIGYSKCDSCRHREKCREQCLAIDDFSTDDYLKIPQYVYNTNKELYWDTIKKSINDDPVLDSPLSNLIFEIGPNHIITTNFDHLLEASANNRRKFYDVVISDKDLLRSKHSKYIIKMHGDISNLRTIVLKESDYLNYSQNHVLIEMFIKSLIADHVIMFLGYSLNDYNVKMIISWINYLRSQNGAIPNNRYIGYMVLDEERINKEVISYYRKNNIKVLNIHDFSLTKDVPSLLLDPRGKRLYSFLKTFTTPVLEMEAFTNLYMEKMVSFLTEHNVYDYKLILQKLFIGSYDLYNGQLIIYDDDQYRRMEVFLESQSKSADYLQQLLANSGIESIILRNDNNGSSFEIIKKSALLSDPCFGAYIQNDYKELQRLYKSEANNFKKFFYQHFIYGYDEITPKELEKYNNKSIRDTLCHMYNTGILSIINTYSNNASQIIHYVDNIESESVRQVYQYYKDICQGNDSRKLNITEALNNLKLNVHDNKTIFLGKGGSIYALYKIKSLTLAHYLFYYTNYLFTQGISDASSFFRIYIEGIICANSNDAGRPYTNYGIETGNQKYSVTPIDIDLLTKYISTKDLDELLTTYRITHISSSPKVIGHTIRCFINLIKAMVEIGGYGYRDSTITTLSNLALIMTTFELSDEQEYILLQSLQDAFSDLEFNCHLWRLFPDNRAISKSLAQLCKKMHSVYNILCVKTIISSPDFFEALGSISVYTARDIIETFLPGDGHYDDEISELIDNEKETIRKIVLLRLFRHRITNKEIKRKYEAFLSCHFSALDTTSIYDFVFSKWLVPSQKDISELIKKTLKTKRDKIPGIEFFPDPIKTKLDCIYILYINGYIKDISELDIISNEHPHLMFLLHPDTFDYTKVDFTDYMWENFARHPQHMKQFVQHRKEIIPKIMDRLNKDEATEAEKKILYGWLLSKKEIWRKT